MYLSTHPCFSVCQPHPFLLESSSLHPMCLSLCRSLHLVPFKDRCIFRRVHASRFRRGAQLTCFLYLFFSPLKTRVSFHAYEIINWGRMYHSQEYLFSLESVWLVRRTFARISMKRRSRVELKGKEGAAAQGSLSLRSPAKCKSVTGRESTAQALK